MFALYWKVGKRITEQQTVLGWGKSVFETLSWDIQKKFPGIKGFGVRNLWNIVCVEYQLDGILQLLVTEIS